MLMKCVSNGGYKLTIGKEYDVKDSPNNRFVKVINDCGNECTVWKSRFKPISPTEEAVRLLTEAGYTVTPPQPLVGEVVVWYFTSLGRDSYHVSDSRAYTDGKDKTIITRLPWSV